MPDSGNAVFKRIDIFNEMSKLRTTLGVCPQLDVLFDTMTVREHLEMFYVFKNPENNFLLQHSHT